MKKGYSQKASKALPKRQGEVSNPLLVAGLLVNHLDLHSLSLRDANTVGTA